MKFIVVQSLKYLSMMRLKKMKHHWSHCLHFLAEQSDLIRGFYASKFTSQHVEATNVGLVWTKMAIVIKFDSRCV